MEYYSTIKEWNHKNHRKMDGCQKYSSWVR